jgi:cyclic pyranopterin phosphate synthase
MMRVEASVSPRVPLTHTDDAGDARMVDVGEKPETERTAVAEGAIALSSEALAAVVERTAKKGDVLAVAQIAGIQAAKRTADLIPLCHPLPITSVQVTLEPADGRVTCRATVRTRGRTGVEMEALTAVSVALLTVYDMLKAVDRSMVISDLTLYEKTGGKSGDYRRDKAL